VFGNIFAFVAGLCTAGLVSFVYPQLRGAQARSPQQEQSEPQGEERTQGLEGGVLDLNDATEEELQELSGIGPALSTRIVENRPYRNKLELVSRMVIPEAAYERIKDQIGVSEDSAEEPIQVAI
jgi:DNA uptake protein ComE-like DNA-binding protein